MSTLHPPQHSIPLVVFTTSGYIRGNCHLPTVRNLRAFLNSGEEILKLTEVVLPGSPNPHPFLALQKSAALLIFPGVSGASAETKIGARSSEGRMVTCLLSLGSIRGRMEMPEAVRTSDFLSRNPWFLAFHDCHLGPNPYLDPKEEAGEAIPMVLVNSRSLVGIAEEAPLATPPRRAEDQPVS